MREELILIGNGMAGIRTLEELLKLSQELYDITVFGGEPTVTITASCCHPFWPEIRG